MNSHELPRQPKNQEGVKAEARKTIHRPLTPAVVAVLTGLAPSSAESPLHNAVDAFETPHTTAGHAEQVVREESEPMTMNITHVVAAAMDGRPTHISSKLFDPRVTGSETPVPARLMGFDVHPEVEQKEEADIASSTRQSLLMIEGAYPQIQQKLFESEFWLNVPEHIKPKVMIRLLERIPVHEQYLAISAFTRQVGAISDPIQQWVLVRTLMDKSPSGVVNEFRRTFFEYKNFSDRELPVLVEILSSATAGQREALFQAIKGFLRSGTSRDNIDSFTARSLGYLLFKYEEGNGENYEDVLRAHGQIDDEGNPRGSHHNSFLIEQVALRRQSQEVRDILVEISAHTESLPQLPPTDMFQLAILLAERLQHRGEMDMSESIVLDELERLAHDRALVANNPIFSGRDATLFADDETSLATHPKYKDVMIGVTSDVNNSRFAPSAFEESIQERVGPDSSYQKITAGPEDNISTMRVAVQRAFVEVREERPQLRVWSGHGLPDRLQLSSERGITVSVEEFVDVSFERLRRQSEIDTDVSDMFFLGSCFSGSFIEKALTEVKERIDAYIDQQVVNQSDIDVDRERQKMYRLAPRFIVSSLDDFSYSAFTDIGSKHFEYLLERIDATGDSLETIFRSPYSDNTTALYVFILNDAGEVVRLR